MPDERIRRRRGRPKAGESEQRRIEVIEAALDELVEHGVAKTTMASIAKRAGASKETLYSWFESRDGLVAALIRHNADVSAERVHEALAGGEATLDTLTGFGGNLLRLLTSPASIARDRMRPSWAVLMAPARVTNILPPACTWASYARAARTTSRLL